MPNPEPPVIMHMALRRLADEARQRLAGLEAGSPDRDFYVGVMTAAEDLARTSHAEVRAISDRSRAFKDGYIAVSNLVGAAGGHTPVRFPLPTPGR